MHYANAEKYGAVRVLDFSYDYISLLDRSIFFIRLFQ